MCNKELQAPFIPLALLQTELIPRIVTLEDVSSIVDRLERLKFRDLNKFEVFLNLLSILY